MSILLSNLFFLKRFNFFAFKHNQTLKNNNYKTQLFLMNLVLEGKSLQTLQTLDLKSPEKVIHLDVSNNFLCIGQDFLPFKNIKTLIIDNNSFGSLSDFPSIPTLVTFSANKNQFKDLLEFCTILPEKFPNLKHISLVKNIICPLLSADETEYAKYRKCLLISLPGLINIDGEAVDDSERKAISKTLDSNKPKGGIRFEEGKDEDDEDDNVYKGTIEYNEKYKYKSSSKNIKTKSEGNRFLKNEQL